MNREQIDEVLVEVPEALLMTTRSAAQGELGSVLHEYGSTILVFIVLFAECLLQFSVDPTSALCIHLLHEKSLGARSTWFPFISTHTPCVYHLAR